MTTIFNDTPVYYTHATYGDDGAYMPFQLIADMSGLAPKHATSSLCLHPKFGPWFSLRAMVMLPPTEPPVLSQPAPPLTPPADLEAENEG